LAFELVVVFDLDVGHHDANLFLWTSIPGIRYGIGLSWGNRERASLHQTTRHTRPRDLENDQSRGPFGGDSARRAPVVPWPSKRGAQSPFTLTAIGQALYRVGQGLPPGTAAALGRLVAGAASPGIVPRD